MNNNLKQEENSVDNAVKAYLQKNFKEIKEENELVESPSSCTDLDRIANLLCTEFRKTVNNLNDFTNKIAES